jgi:hypothetical protein
MLALFQENFKSKFLSYMISKSPDAEEINNGKRRGRRKDK